MAGAVGMGIRGAIEDIQPFAELAQNATTVVYKAYQQSLERFVLLKRLQPEFSTDEELSARFQKEARLIARVPHPNIVAIYSYGSDADGAYIIAEYVDGKNLDALIKGGRIPPAVALFILSESARALKAAHDKNILHRDLKPSNILISNDGEVKLSDFGLAGISGDSSDGGEIRGTLPYLAPEQVIGEGVDRRSDVFSLGAVFYEMLTGRRAYAGATSSEIFENLLHHDPRPFLASTPGVDDDVERVCARMMAREPSQRYGDADELIADVERVRADVGGSAGQTELRAFVDNPESFKMLSVPRVGGRVDDPNVTIVSDMRSPRRSADERTLRRGRGTSLERRVGLVLAVLLAAAGIIYAGTSFLGVKSTVTDANRSALQETTLAETLSSAGDANLEGTSASDYGDTAAADLGDPSAAELGDPTAANLGDPPAADFGNPVGANLEDPPAPGLGIPAQNDSQVQEAVVETDPGDDDITGVDPQDAGDEAGDEIRADDPAIVATDPDRSPAGVGDERTEETAVFGRLEVRVEPAAVVFVDGDSVGTVSGRSAVSLQLEAGIHTLTLKNRYFPTHTQRVLVSADQTQLVEVSLFDLVGRLDLHVQPWAVVYVDGDSVGVTPFNPPLILVPGVHHLRLVHENLNVDHTVTLTIEKGRTMRREFDLTRLNGQ